jgi:hypothetical protein
VHEVVSNGDNPRTYCYGHSMADHMYVQVPADLWVLLEADDFDEVETSSRSADQWPSVAQAVLSIGEQGLNVTTQLVAVYLAREQIGDFVNRVAAWLGLSPRAASAPPSLTFTVTAGAGAGDDKHSVVITCPVGLDGTPVVDAAALTGAIVSALDAHPPAAG